MGLIQEVTDLREQLNSLREEMSARDMSIHESLANLGEHTARLKRLIDGNASVKDQLEETRRRRDAAVAYADLGAAAQSADQLQAAMAEAACGRELIAILSEHYGERGDSEGAADTLERIIRERDALSALHDSHVAQKESLRDQLRATSKKLRELGYAVEYGSEGEVMIQAPAGAEQPIFKVVGMAPVDAKKEARRQYYRNYRAKKAAANGAAKKGKNSPVRTQRRK